MKKEAEFQSVETMDLWAHQQHGQDEEIDI